MLRITGLVAVALALGGCAAMNQLDSDVSTYSQWPSQRKPASYVFERLPSQQARPEQQLALEAAARPALEKAGFVSAPEGQGADFSVQVGARLTSNERSPFDDPFWWRGGFQHGFGYSRFGRSYWPGWYARPESSRYEREVAVLIRDRKTGQPLYEARANNDGFSAFVDGVLPAMFEAAMKDFPHAGINPRQVTTELSKAP